jgi:hypothetical protein
MSASIEEQYKYAEAKAEELKAPTVFDARAAVKNATFPTDSIDVYSDAELAHELNLVANDAAKARYLAETIKTAFEANPNKTVEDAPEDAPGYKDADAEAAVLETQVAGLIQKLQGSILTYHVRGLAPTQWRLIDAKWRKEIKPPARKNYPQTEEGEEEYQLAVYERDVARIAKIKHDQIASAITKVVRKEDGAEDTAIWSVDDVENIYDTYQSSEYDKLQNLVLQLSFASNLFQVAVEKGADFLSKR